MATVYIGNLPPEISDSELREIFGEYGKVSSLRLLSGRGMAFVELKPEAADAAVEALRGTQLQGRTLDVAIERSSGRRRPSSRGGRRRRR